MCACVLIVEDDKDFLRLLQIDLKQNGYTVMAASDGLEGLRLFHEGQPDLVMLDIALPQMSGLQVCEQIRQSSNVPILMMTGHAVSEAEIAQGLNMGADEYMVKPLRKMELHARVSALLRRAGIESSKASSSYEDHYLSVDARTRRVRVDGREIRLTPTEFKLLMIFIDHPDEVMTFEQLLHQVWGAAYSTEHHYPRIYVSHLRHKIEPDPNNPVYIQNEYGIGYRFVGRSP
jgi:two-component system KDP operon response regulator KdpE